jgi:hypothetical protein
MRKKHFVQAGAILTVLALCALLSAPVQAATRAFHTNSHSANATTSINANVYLTAQMIHPMSQSSISQQIPQIVGNAIASTVNQLPKQDQDWAAQMANALLQPSATLLSLTPEKGGLLATLKVSLYPGDPRPTTTSILIGFSVTNPTTIQVTALPAANGGQSVVSGPLTTFHVPIGTLNSITTTANCGDADLSINLKFPVSLGQAGQTSSQSTLSTMPVAYTSVTTPAAVPAPYTNVAASMAVTTSSMNVTAPAADPASYVEIPASSLAQLGSSMGTLPISSSLTAQNIRVGVSGSDLTATSDIYWYGLDIGTAVSTLAPGAASGNLVVHVLNTNLQILDGLISFPMNSYNQQVEQMLNTKLNSALTGKFTVTQAAIGANPHLSCAGSNSLVLGGTLALG